MAGTMHHPPPAGAYLLYAPMRDGTARGAGLAVYRADWAFVTEFGMQIGRKT